MSSFQKRIVGVAEAQALDRNSDMSYSTENRLSLLNLLFE